MLKKAGYSVVAEGIETEEQANTLRALGADRLQGYYYHRPMPEADIVRLFEILETPFSFFLQCVAV